jgi:hypothetical protein
VATPDAAGRDTSAVQHVGSSAPPGEAERIPDRVARKRREAGVATEREGGDVDVVTALQLTQQRLEVARRPRAGLDER